MKPYNALLNLGMGKNMHPVCHPSSIFGCWQAILLIMLLFILPVHAAKAEEEKIEFGRFGTITLYHQVPHPAHVVLFVSGDGGWNLGVVDMARELSSMDALVAGIDITHYMKELAQANEKCSYPAADFEELSQYIQKRLNFPRYTIPVLVGYSSGATLVYATLVQAPAGTFAGAISMGFCPDLPVSKPFCKGYGLEWKPGPKKQGVSFLPAQNLQTPWIALQGIIDQVCNPEETEKYVKQVGNGELVSLPKVGHGFSVPKNWMPQFREAFSRLVSKIPPAAPSSRESLPVLTKAPEVQTSGKQLPAEQQQPRLRETPLPPASVKDLPIIEVPAKQSSSNRLVVIFSGDGGWAGIDKDMANNLSSRGISVVGLNSLQYLWTSRTPEGIGKDLERILRYYLAAWKKEDAILIGYSSGADVLPFGASRLPEDLLKKVRLIALLGLESMASFEFHVADWFGSSKDSAFPVLPELKKLKELKILCFYGVEEEDSLCRQLPEGFGEPIVLKGGHHFGGDYQTIVDRILKEDQGQE